MKLTTLLMAGLLMLGLVGTPAQAQVADAGKLGKGENGFHTFVPEPTLAKVSYGPARQNTLAFWRAESVEPTPVVIVIHGGGWNGGSLKDVGKFVRPRQLLDAGISVVSINYRKIKHAKDLTPPVQGPMEDGARAVQFVRSQAQAWNIDPERIGLTGGSAGGCTSLWIAYHDDRADPDSDDPVARESTRVKAVAVIRAQTTLDPKQMKAWIPNSKYGGHAFGLGRDSFDRFLAERKPLLDQIETYSPYALLTADDPPTYLYYPIKPGGGRAEKDPTHSATFGVKLAEKAKSVGVACELVHAGVKNPRSPDVAAYLIAVLRTP